MRIGKSMAGGGQGPTYVSELESTALSFEEDGSQTSSIRASATGSLLFEGSSSGSTCDVSGLGTVTATEFTSVSDRRLKTNIRRLHERPLSLLRKLHGVKFDWKNDDHAKRFGPQIGVIAQSVQQVMPEICSEDPQTGTLTVDYSKLSCLLLECIREMAGMYESDDDKYV
jgi:hypothetical protein